MSAMLLLKASLLLSAALLAARLLRRAPAVTRHGLWSLAFAAVLALPLLASALPALYVPVPAGWGTVAPLRVTPGRVRDDAGAGDVMAIDSTADRRGGNVAPIGDRTPASSKPPLSAHPREGQSAARFAAVWSSAPALLLVAWVIGTTAAVATVLISLLRVRRLARTAEVVCDAGWRSAAATIGTRLGLRRPARLLLSCGVGTPMAGGVWRPAIFLPASARAWSVERRDVVLAHEIAHLAGRDPLRHLVTRLALACYWFHPLAWIAARQAAVAREQACDEAVLALGTRPSAYARVLLDLAESMHRSVPVTGALPMVQRSLLERRLMAILNNDIRPASRRLVLVPAIGVTLLTLSVAAAHPIFSVPAAGQPMAVAVAAAHGTTSAAGAAPVAHVPVKAVPGTVAQTGLGRESACWWDTSDSSSFRGSISTSDSGGRMVIREQVGTRGVDRVIQRSFGDLRLCMVAEDAGDRDTADRPSQWIGRVRRVVLEARRGGVVQRLEVTSGGPRTSWQVGGVDRAFDAAAQQWRDRMLAVLDTTWELSTLRGEVSSLRGEISSIHGERSSLQGEISSLRGEVSSMRGMISSARGEESSLRGQISSIEGHVSSLHGGISSARGAISSLDASRYGADDTDRARIAARVAQHDVEIARLEREIRDYNAGARIAAVEREIAALDANGKVAAIEAQIRAFDLDGKVGAVEHRIAALDVERRVAAIDRQIDSLDADRRARQLEDRRDAELKRLDAAIAAIR